MLALGGQSDVAGGGEMVSGGSGGYRDASLLRLATGGQSDIVLCISEIKRQSSIKTWLRNNKHPAEKVTDLWRESFLLRMREIVEETDVNKAHVVTEWPRLTDEDGYLLIDADFEQIYRYVATSNFFDDWECFVPRYLEYIELNGLKDDYSRQLLTHLESQSVAKDTRDFICCTIFHGLVKPVRTSSRKLPTIL